MKIKLIEIKLDKNGNEMKVLTTENDEKVFVNSKYEEEIFKAINESSEIELIKDGKFWKIKPESVGVTPKPVIGGFKSAQIEKAQNRKENSISKAQDRTELLWAKRSACEMVIHHPLFKNSTEQEAKEKIREITSYILNLKGDEIAPF